MSTRCIAKEGIQPQADLHVPEDHVSFEFEFLATVIERTNAALLTGDFARARALAETVSEFHRLHQLNWIDDLCDAVLDVAETRFYRGVAKVTRGFVIWRPRLSPTSSRCCKAWRTSRLRSAYRLMNRAEGAVGCGRKTRKDRFMGDQPSITRRGVLVGAGAVAGVFAVGGVAYALEGEDRGLLRLPVRRMRRISVPLA